MIVSQTHNLKLTTSELLPASPGSPVSPSAVLPSGAQHPPGTHTTGFECHADILKYY